MNVKERMKKYISFSSMTVSDFEKSLGVSNGYVNNISRNIGIDKLNLIIENYSNLNIEWLLSGKGEMIKQKQVLIPNNRLDELTEIIDMQRKLIKNLESEVKRLGEELEKTHNFPSHHSMAADSKLKYGTKKH